MSISADTPTVAAANSPDAGCIIFEMGLTTAYERIEIVHSWFELWVWKNRGSGPRTFVATLAPELQDPARFPCRFERDKRQTLKLVWHARPEEFQIIEDHRLGGDALLEIRALLTVVAYHRNKQGQLEPSNTTECLLYGSTANVLWTIPVAEWLPVLNRMSFRSAHLIEVPGKLHKDLRVPEQHLARAWNEHRANKPENALAHCFKALECLGFNLYHEDNLTRKEILEQLLPEAPDAKRDRLVQLMAGITDFSHLGRHERSAPIPLDYADSELAVACTSALLRYIGSRFSAQPEQLE